MTPDHDFREYHGRRVTVFGLGSFGGGQAAVQFLVEHGAIVTVTDQRAETQLRDAVSSLHATPPARWQLGQPLETDFTQADLIVVNPAIRRDHPLLKLAEQAHVPLTSEMNLFWQHQSGRITAVTGSNGKSTTTALIHSIMKSAHPEVRLGGNIGRSLLPEVQHIHPEKDIVLELSSFQLTDLDRLGVSPHVSVVTNFSPNHLDWHDTLDHYRWAKQTLLRHQSPTDIAILNADDPDVRHWPTRGQRLYFGMRDEGNDGTFLRNDRAVWRRAGNEHEFPLRDWLKLPGEHNVANALAAITAALATGSSFTDVQSGLENYVPLPHRLQFVGEVHGRKFYNDSLATTPESALMGMAAFTAPVILFAGGYDKKVDLGEFATGIAQRTKAVALLGQTAHSLAPQIQAAANCTTHASQPFSDLRTAFRWAWEQSAPGDVILLSPGCASYDWFRNFADRGDQFMQLVTELSRTT